MQNLIYTTDDDDWVAKCLQMDAVATDKTREAVERDMIGLILDKARVALETDKMAELFKNAPAEVWRKLEKATFCDVKNIDVSAGMDPDCAVHSKIRDVEFCYV